MIRALILLLVVSSGVLAGDNLNKLDVSPLANVPTLLPYDTTAAYSAGDNTLYQGYQVVANASIPANTAFSWGTTGATWAPASFAAAWKGVYAAGTTYALGEVVASDTTSTAMYKSLAAANLGNALNIPTKWSAASFTVAPTTSTPILAYQVGETYYVGQHICYNGLIVTPNATVPAGTTFAWGSTGATFKLDLDTAGAFFAVNTEYVSPNQHGNIYGKVYRTYFTTTLPAYLTAGSSVSKIVDYTINFTNGTNRYVGRGETVSGSANVDMNLSGTTGKGNLSIGSASWTLTDGWVDYTK
jgi:hypothetical protein